MGEELGKWKKIAWCMGSLTASLPYTVFTAYVTYFYVGLLGLPIEWWMIGFTAFAVWNAINDPLFGHFSDRTRTRYGRRIPWIMISVVPLGLTTYLLWVPPVGEGILLFVYFISIIFLFDTFYTIAVLNWTALFPEMFRSLGERASVNGLRQFFTLIAVALGLSLAPLLYGIFGWGAMGAVVGLATSVSLFISLLGSKEEPEHGEPMNFYPAFKKTLVNRSFASFGIYSFLFTFTQSVFLATAPFFVVHVLGAGEIELSLFYLVMIISTLISFYPWSKIQAKVGPRKVAIASSLMFCAVLSSLLFFVHSFGDSLIVMVFMGIPLAGNIISVDVLISYVIDEDELRTGRRREGVYFGVHGFIIRLSIAAQAIVMGAMLAGAGFVEGAAVQPAPALVALRLLMSAVPIAALLLGVLSLRFYPIFGKRLERIREHMERRH